MFRKPQRNGLTDAAPGSRYESHFSIQPEIARSIRLVPQSDTPRFHGMKSSCAFTSAFTRASPLATCTT